MVERVNGSIRQGVWVEADVRFVNVDVTAAADFLADLVLDSDSTLGTTPGGTSGLAQRIAAVGSELEQVVEIVATRGTILGLTVEADGFGFNVMLGYAQAYDDAAVVTELQTAIDLVNGSFTAAITVEEGFAPLVFGTAT